MAEKKDLVVKMTINSTDFQSGLKNAKSSMKNFDLSIGNLTKSFAKFAGGIGAAVSVSAVFFKNMKSIETVSDTVDMSMKVVDESIKSLFTTINTNSFKGLIDGLNNVVKNAKEAYNALDNLGTYLNFSSVEAARNQAAQSEARYMISAIKKGDAEGDIEYWEKELRRLQSEAETIIDKEIKHYNEAIAKSDKLLFDRFKGNEVKLQQFREQYTGTADKNDFANQRYNELESQRKETARLFGKNSTRNTVYKDFMANYGDELAFLEIIVKREKDLSEINKLIIAQENKKTQLYGEKRANLKYLAGEASTTTTSTVTTTGTTTTAERTMTADQVLQYISKGVENALFARDKEKDNALIEIELLDEGVVEEATDKLVEGVKKAQEEMALLAIQTQQAFAAGSALASAFTAFGNISDNTLGKVSNGLGAIIGQIVSTVQAMMSLAGAETIEGIADVFANTKGGALIKIAMAATAAAGILSIIGTARNSFAGSFAEGGIVGGSSYSGDKLWARVNSGEMIIPYNDWHNGGQGVANGQVEFVIEGSQLKGVLKNYETIESI